MGLLPLGLIPAGELPTERGAHLSASVGRTSALMRIAAIEFAPFALHRAAMGCVSGGSTMRADAKVADDDTRLSMLPRQTAVATTILTELWRRPIVRPEWLSLEDMPVYIGYSEEHFSKSVKRGIARKAVLFNRNALRLERSNLDASRAAGRPRSYGSKGDAGAVRQ